MNLKKVLLGLTLMAAFAGTAFAEQPTAGKYRQILQSGTYYVEYSIRMYDLEKTNPSGDKKKVALTDIGQNGKKETMVSAKAGVDDIKEMEYRTIFPSKSMGIRLSEMGQHTSHPFGTGFIYSVSNAGENRLQSIKQIVKKKGHSLPIPIVDVRVGGGTKTYVTPRIMHQNGQYYRFVNDKHGFDAFRGKAPKVSEAITVSDANINSSALDPSEGWWNIRSELALPKEFTIFFANDPYIDYINILQMPLYQESLHRTMGKKEYECDRYISTEKDGENGNPLNFAYYAMYQDGELTLIQKYLVAMDGEEDLVEEVFVRKLSGQLPEGAFDFSESIPVYAAGIGDADDFLGISKQVGVLGGSAQ